MRTRRSAIRSLTLVAAVTGATFAVAAPPAKEAKRPTAERATAEVESKSGSQVKGTASFRDDGKGGLVFTLDVVGATPGKHAVHIHDKGDCSSPDGKSAGDHWNPTQKPHGQWGAHGDAHHLGDIGNLEVGADGKGVLTLSTTKWAVGTGAPNDILGHSVVVHGGVDDFKSQPAGNAGPRVGCGVIKAAAK